MSYGNYVNHTIHQYARDFTRPTKFNITLNLPESLTLDADKNRFSNVLNVLAKNFSIPTIKNEPIEIKYRGQPIPVPGRTTFEQTFTLTFYSDEPQLLRTSLDRWIREMDPKLLSKNYKDFENKENFLRTGTLLVESLNFEENSAKKKFKFYNVYPTNLQELQFNTDSPSTVSEITVTFAYTHFEVLKGDLDLSNIFEDFVNRKIDSTIDSLFGQGTGKNAKKSIAAIVDIFQKG
jgi:hypothetical protein